MPTIADIKSKTDVPVIVANQFGVITFVNSAFESIFGWTAAEAQGKPITLIIPPVLHDAHQLGFSRFISTEKPTILGKPLNLRAVDKSGHEFDAEHFLVAEKIDGQWVIAATVKPLK